MSESSPNWDEVIDVVSRERKLRWASTHSCDYPDLSSVKAKVRGLPLSPAIVDEIEAAIYSLEENASLDSHRYTGA